MKFLIFGGPGIGDTIIELAMAKGLKKGFPDAQVDLILSNALGTYTIVENILLCQNFISNCHYYSKKELWATFKSIIKMRHEKYDYSFSCATAFKANDIPGRISRLIGCKSITKEVKGKTGHIDIPVSVDENIHSVEQNQELCRQLIPDCKLDLLVLDSTKIPEIPINTDKEKIVTICLGTNVTIYRKEGERIDKNIKSWDTDRWIQTANMLDNDGYCVVLIGGKKELEELNNAKSELNKTVNNYVGTTSILESLGIIKQSDMVIGADTGMMHCAAALDIPTITLFGGTDARIWRPYSDKGTIISGNTNCAPCYGKDYAIECKERKCMNSISVERVMDELNKRME